MTNLVRLRDRSILVLDEPEIFLHPEKQHVLIRALREYFDGSMIIATHSPELMNQTEFSHIIYVQRDKPSPKTISSKNRNQLDQIRRNIGSSFNLVASQFEDVELVIATENVTDYEVITDIARISGIKTGCHNVTISSLNKWEDCVQYKNAHKSWFGTEVKFHLLLDRDFYPQEYLDHIANELARYRITTSYTPGNEIENLFIQQELLLYTLPTKYHPALNEYLDRLYADSHDPTVLKYVTGAHNFPNKNKGHDFDLIYEEIKPTFEAIWNNRNQRHRLPDGKQFLQKIRSFVRANTGINLTSSLLIQKMIESRNLESSQLVTGIFN
jgi:hypothetical protein